MNVAFFQFVCLSLASGSSFSSVGSITFLSLDAAWHALLEHRNRATAITVWIRRAPPVQDCVTRRASSRHLGGTAEMHSHGFIFITENSIYYCLHSQVRVSHERAKPTNQLPEEIKFVLSLFLYI